jgi:putative peptidoglycan lipid II flippase
MKHIARSSLIIAIFFGIDKILAFGRALIINNQFGLSYELDVFNAANNIPDLLSALISGGALGVALIPVLSEYLEKRGRKDAWELFTRVLNLAFVVTGVIAVLIAIFAPWLMDNVIAPGFPAEQRLLATELMRLDLIAILIFSISGLAMAGLQANQHFILPALAPAMYNIGQIFGAMVLAPTSGYSFGSINLPHFGMGVQGLVYGVILGALLHLGIQVPGLLRFGFRWRPIIGLRTRGVQQVMTLLGPRVLTMFFIQLFFITRDNLASRLGEGSVTALNLGWFIMQVPETLLGTAVAIALLPSIAELFSRGERQAFQQTINGTIRTILALTIPSAVLLGVGLRPLVTAAFPAFDSQGVEMVVSATRVFLIGLAGHALLEIAARSFYAQQDARVPLYAAALNSGVYILLAITLSSRIGHVGIAWANTIAFTLEAIVLLWLLNRSYPGLLNVGNTVLRVGFVSLMTGLGLFALLKVVPFPPIFVSIGGMLGGLVIVALSIRPELRIFLNMGERSENRENQ